MTYTNWTRSELDDEIARVRQEIHDLNTDLRAFFPDENPPARQEIAQQLRDARAELATLTAAQPE